MKSKRVFAQKLSQGIVTTLALAMLAAATTATAQARRYTVLHDFTDTNGAFPRGNLIFDASGNLYGVTGGGGIVNKPECLPAFNFTSCGTVFKLTKASGGGWTGQVLYEFTGGSDGANPQAGLVFDSAGNLFGTTYAGGLYGLGVAFELSPDPDGTWNETVLHAFGSGNDGSAPAGNLIFDASGKLYGTTFAGGPSCGFAISCGTVFELSPNSSGGWSETVIYAFASVSDGMNPDAGLVFDAHGNLYGTTMQGGNLSNVNCGYPYYGCGSVFKLSPNSAGGWTKTTLYIFDDADGAYPQSALIFDGKGNLYGTTALGGDPAFCGGQLLGCGVVFRLSPRPTGGWAPSTLRAFLLNSNSAGPGGERPLASLLLDAAGNLYGTASGGGQGVGVVFKLSPPSSTGGWKETVLHTFSGNNGYFPMSGLTPDAAGNLFGMTFSGGNLSDCQGSGCGAVFEITP